MSIADQALTLGIASCICCALGAAQEIGSVPVRLENRQPGSLPVSATRTVTDDALMMFKGAIHIVSAPARWDGGDWWLAGGVVGVTGGAILLDDEVDAVMDRIQTRSNDQVNDVVVEYGSGLYATLLSAGLYGTGIVVEDDWLRDTGLLLGTSLLCATTFSSGIKALIGRGRPLLGRGNHYLRPFTTSAMLHSFPSGHTVVAFTVTSVLAERIGHPVASVGLYGMAGLCAMARMYSKSHWLSDVVFSGLFAMSVGRSVVLWHEAREPSNTPSALRIFPTGGGIRLAWFL